jgi:hypothetical protein
MALCGLALLALVEVAWAGLPAPLPYVCQMTEELGCFNDSWSRTFPVSVSEGVVIQSIPALAITHVHVVT